MTRIEWTYTVETSRLLRALALVAFGAIGGLFVLVAALAAVVVAGSLLAGEFAVLAILLAFGLLGARRLATHTALARSNKGGFPEFASGRELLAASVGWAAFLGALLALDVPSQVVYACILVAVFACLPLAAALRSDGCVDTAEGVFEANDREVSLAAVDDVRQYDLGPVSVLRVRYHDGAGGASDPRIVTVPREDADRVRTALESSEAEPPANSRNPTITRTLYAFGVGSFALAAAFAYFALTESGDATIIGGYVAVFAGFFGALFVWLGYVEG
ncbi:hypothetical protein [Halobacterium noricense]|uniref:hypothetical protein n=1 Tax=Halobacterium noricense TaxID=223182 RepID=UPI001E4C6966|nr:hypothetical protein [Halobacterium noricense]UHH24452.1 hypothetical protein LT974_10685 [Halobacterium noricense]